MLYRCYSRGEGILVNNVKAEEIKNVANKNGIPIDVISSKIEGYEL